MAAEWEAAAMGMGMDLGMGIHHHNTTMPPTPNFYGGGGGDAMLDFFPMPTTGAAATSSSGVAAASGCFNLSFAGDDEFSIPVPREEAAELEWLSNFVDDSYPDMPPSYPPEVQAAIAAAAQQQQQQQPAVTGARSKRSRAHHHRRPEKPAAADGIDSSSSSNSNNSSGDVRRCTHCASEKTPQWRSGPLGPKTLCNACGVRYKSGRLVPEYRPAASPTFVLTQHSNSHRKVMELRRQKDIRATTFRDHYALC